MAIHDLQSMLNSLAPILHEGVYVFATWPDSRPFDPGLIVASIREADGLSVVLAETDAEKLGLAGEFRAAWITLDVHSALSAVGLTRAFSAALAKAGISCNVVAGIRHDHLFVPIDQAESAMAALRQLQADSK